MAMFSKKNLVRALSERLSIPQTEAAPLVEAFVGVLTDAIVQNTRVEIRGFGRWLVRSKPAYTARNPVTGGSVPVAARRVVSFKPATDLKSAVAAATIEAASA